MANNLKIDMNGYERLINECDKNIEYYTNHLKLLRSMIALIDDVMKIFREVNPKSKLEDFEEMKHFNNYNGYLTIALIELSVILKNLCLAKTNWEKGFFIKHGYLVIFETIAKLKPTKGVSFIQQTIDAKYPLLKVKFHNALLNIETFKANNNYKRIVNIRHSIAAHIDKSLKKYYDTVFELDGEEAARDINEFLNILDEILIITKEYAIYANAIQGGISKEIDDKLNNANALINEFFRQ